MRRTLCVVFAALLAAKSASAWDQLPNRYHVSVDAKAKRAHVEADIWLEGRELALFGVNPSARHKNGQADFLERIAVQDAQGRALALADKGEGEYEVAGDQRVRLSYDVRLEHDSADWPGGVEEVLYHTDEGMMATGYALFLVPGVKMLGQTEVQFTLPPGWQAQTPWRAGASAHSFVVDSRRELVNNALFLGTARTEHFTAGGVRLALVMGQRYWAQRAVFMELIERQMQSYIEMFGKPPLAERYLLVINQGDTGDGGAFSGSFSQFLKGDGDAATRAIWGRVVAHELLHFWNGHALVPAHGSEEWFKEGVTDYLTVTTLVRNGLAGRDFLMQQLENLARGQLVARRLMGLTGTVRAAVKDKHRNWLLVYGGGTIAGMAMDLELRRASGGKTGLPELMKALYAEFGEAGKSYTEADIVRIGKALAAVDLGPVLAPIVASDSAPDLAPLYRQIGLQLEQYGMLDTYLLRSDGAPAAARQRFTDLFGIAY